MQYGSLIVIKAKKTNGAIIHKTFIIMKQKQVVLSIAVAAIVTMSAIFAACSKSTSAQGSPPSASTQSVSLYLTDAPAVFNNVYLDVKSIEVLIDSSKNTRQHDSLNWDDMGERMEGMEGSGGMRRPDSASFVATKLNFSPGVYDLLKLRNGVDTLLSTSTIPAGNIRLIRINLGTNCSVVKDSVSYTLHLPPNAPSYILIKLEGNEWEEFETNAYRLWLDFDVARSIVNMDNTYYLVPFLRNFVPNKSGSVEGNIAPIAAMPAFVKLFNATDSSFAMPNEDGEFKIRGLKDGSYSLLVHSAVKNGNGTPMFKDTTINNVVIQNANHVSFRNIMLHP